MYIIALNLNIVNKNFPFFLFKLLNKKYEVELKIYLRYSKINRSPCGYHSR